MDVHRWMYRYVRCRPGSIATATSAPLLVTLPTGSPRTSRRRSTISDVLLRTYPCLVSCLERRRHCLLVGHARPQSSDPSSWPHLSSRAALIRYQNFSGTGVYLPASTIHHQHGQCVVGRRLTARLTKARDCFASAEEARPAA